jgi:hypothetical protein
VRLGAWPAWLAGWLAGCLADARLLVPLPAAAAAPLLPGAPGGSAAGAAALRPPACLTSTPPGSCAGRRGSGAPAAGALAHPPNTHPSLNTPHLRRARLSYEAFSRFLQIVKELNSGNSRDDTLRRARELFGVANSDLYGELPAP